MTYCNSCGAIDSYISNSDNCICNECGTPDDFEWEDDYTEQEWNQLTGEK